MISWSFIRDASNQEGAESAMGIVRFLIGWIRNTRGSSALRGNFVRTRNRLRSGRGLGLLRKQGPPVNRPWRGFVLLGVASILGLTSIAGTSESDSLQATPSPIVKPTFEGRTAREACRDRDPLRRPFFGDLHVHTTFSLDASTMDTRNRPSDAYRFAQGQSVGLQPYRSDGSPMRSAQLDRPLDFAAVTDHAELLGETEICRTPDLPGYESWVCHLYRGWPRGAFFWMNFQASRGVRHDFCGQNGERCLEAARSPWQETIEAAEAAYDRSDECSFTSFIGYEWTGAAGSGNNFHRNVIFENDVVPDLPLSFIDQPDLESFWNELGAGCKTAGDECDVVVIPHNSNLSAGKMFRTTQEDGSPISRSEAETRQRYEVLVEMIQHKGESECFPGLGNSDERCGFEKLSVNSFTGRYFWASDTEPKARQFVRNILREGIQEKKRVGVNPFQFGLIGSTDTHLGTPGLVAETDQFPGHGGAGKPAGDALPTGLPDLVEYNPGGLAVLWAEENSRASLFAAMKRREAYATSGPRMVVRFFGGYDLPENYCELSQPVATGYARGVPMGGTLPKAPTEASAPYFAVSVLADPGTPQVQGTSLERVQIIKGWTTEDATHERVYDVNTGQHPPGSVDLQTCETAGQGDRSLCSVWQDPDWDPSQSAFYYVRALENPTCRWSQRVCLAAGVQCDEANAIPEGFEPCCSEDHRPVIQERAWTSPIWYHPDDA